jgi:hypothetical protein
MPSKAQTAIRNGNGPLKIQYPPHADSLPRITQAIDVATAAGIPVVAVQHTMGEDAPASVRVAGCPVWAYTGGSGSAIKRSGQFRLCTAQCALSPRDRGPLWRPPAMIGRHTDLRARNSGGTAPSSGIDIRTERTT